MRLLVVEDDRRISGFLVRGLRENAYAVDAAFDGPGALDLALVNTYDLIVLDVMLPVIDGLDVCRRLRGLKNNTPIILLTARDGLSDRISGLDAGADDYLVKPFAFEELLARLRALLRRHGAIRPAVIKIADLQLDTIGKRAFRSGREIPLTTKEYTLLEYFASEKGKVLGRSAIAEHVWDENFDAFSNLIDVYVKRLRDKLDNGFEVKLIHTRRGLGYIFDDA